MNKFWPQVLMLMNTGSLISNYWSTPTLKGQLCEDGYDTNTHEKVCQVELDTN